jgi:hypothetical protein
MFFSANHKYYQYEPFNKRTNPVCRIDLDKKSVRIKLWLPHLRMTSQYKIDGRVLMMPISGRGYNEGNYSKYSGG